MNPNKFGTSHEALPPRSELAQVAVERLPIVMQSVHNAIVGGERAATNAAAAALREHATAAARITQQYTEQYPQAPASHVATPVQAAPNALDYPTRPGTEQYQAALSGVTAHDTYPLQAEAAPSSATGDGSLEPLSIEQARANLEAIQREMQLRRGGSYGQEWRNAA